MLQSAVSTDSADSRDSRDQRTGRKPGQSPGTRAATEGRNQERGLQEAEGRRGHSGRTGKLSTAFTQPG